MSYPVTAVDQTVTMNEVKELLMEKGCTGLPVIHKNKLVGVISRRDFKKVKQKKQMDAPVKAFMSKDPVSIGPEKTPMEAAKIMVKHDIGRLPVIKDGEILEQAKFYKPGTIKGITIYLNGTNKGTKD